MGSFFAGDKLNDKIAQKLIQIGVKTKTISNPASVVAVLGASAGAASSNFAICTETEIAYVESGFFYKANKYPLSSVTGIIQESKSLSKHFVSLTIGGGQKIIMAIPARKEDAVAFVDFVNALMSSKTTGGAPLSSADEIKKFKELLDQGIITQEEFDAKKKQLLGL